MTYRWQIAQLYGADAPERNQWLKTAADNGHIEAAYELATRLAPTDAQTAAIYYQKAVDGGHIKGIADYGTILMTGRYGFTKDEAKAQALLARAANQGSLEARSAQLQTSDAVLAKYVAQIPQLLNAVRQGDADAIVKLMLIYKALNDDLMFEKMRTVALYNFSYSNVPIPAAFNRDLIKVAGLEERISKEVDDGRAVYRMGNYQGWSKKMRPRKTNIEVLAEDLLTSTPLYAKDIATDIRKEGEKYKIIVDEKLQSIVDAKKGDNGQPAVPWIRQLKTEGYLWTEEVAAQSVEVVKKKAEKARQEFYQGIKERGKKIGATAFEVHGVVFNMVPVKGGGQYIDRGGWEKGRVTKSYMIAETEITEDLWRIVMKRTSGSNSQHPAMAGWKEWELFIQELNNITGKKFRFPTRAEWLYAAQGGLKSKGYKYSGSNQISDVAWTDRAAHAVATKKPNELGLYDMSGNVWEWNDDNGSSTNILGGGYEMSRGDSYCVNPSSNYSSNLSTPHGLRLVLDMPAVSQARRQ